MTDSDPAGKETSKNKGTPEKGTSENSTSGKLTPERGTSRKLTPGKLTPGRSTPGKSAPVNGTPGTKKTYREAVGEQHIKKFSQYFTPVEIASLMCSWVLEKKGNVLDPAAGNLVFVREIRKKDPGRVITGYEIDPEILSYFISDNAADVSGLSAGAPEGKNKADITRKDRAHIVIGDFLTAPCREKYDCIVCNPPYNRFQALENRNEIYEHFERIGEKGLNRYTNESILFLIKSLHLLKPDGRLSFIIPSEFMNSSYGKRVKELLISGKKLRAVINFENDKNIFPGAETTCCVIFLENSRNMADKVKFISIRNSPSDELGTVLDKAGRFLYGDTASGNSGKTGEFPVQPEVREKNMLGKEMRRIDTVQPETRGKDNSIQAIEAQEEVQPEMRVKDTGLYNEIENDISGAVRCREINYSDLEDAPKWRIFFFDRPAEIYRNLVPCSTFFRAVRGIATGANSYFLFSEKKLRETGLTENDMMKCICSSKDVDGLFFTATDFERLKEADKNVFLLDIKENLPKHGSKYKEEKTPAEAWLRYGEELGINSKYLPAHRNPWYMPERRLPAPILIAAAGRTDIKIIRNLCNVNNLTTFHGIYINEEDKILREESSHSYLKDHLTDIIFSCLITPCVKKMIMNNMKILGGGLERFQPNDINDAMMPDIRIISEKDLIEIVQIYDKMKNAAAAYRQQEEILQKHMTRTSGNEEENDNSVTGGKRIMDSEDNENKLMKSSLRRLDNIFSCYVL